MAPVNQELSVGKITIKVRITAPYANMGDTKQRLIVYRKFPNYPIMLKIMSCSGALSGIAASSVGVGRRL